MEELFSGLFETAPREITRNLEAMARTNSLEEKKIHSEIILNLCKSLGVFVETMSRAPADFDEDDEDFDFDSEMLFEEPTLELHEEKPSKRKKKKN